jgi:tetratricopeptide (TPR) repeat protein
VVKIDKILDDLHSADENYNQAIAEGDENYKNQKLPEALTAYKKAAGLKSTEAYPTSQIEKINTQVAEQKKLENDFMLKIGAADKLLATKKYEEAIAIYKEALTLKPAEKYASDKIAEIEKQIADQKSLDESYSKAIAEGEKFIADKDYAKALATFSSASALKPAEAYPKQKSAEMQAILDKDKA